MASVGTAGSAARDGSADSLFAVAPRTPGCVPTLHQLCCDFIVNAVINLENAPTILEFAKMHNVDGLAQRSERFIVSSWRALSDLHDEAVLRDAMGAEAYEALAKDQAELVKPKLGSVVDTPAEPVAAVCRQRSATAPSVSLAPGASSGLVSRDAKAAPPAAAAAAPPLSEAAERARRRFSFGGGGESCERCSKRVYPAEKAPGLSKKVYHIDCFRCGTCSTKLHPHSYELTDEGAPLCKVHHKQHLDSTRRSSLCSSTPSIGGTFYLPDSNCMRCGKRIFATEMQCASAHQGGYGDTQCYHKSCFRCADCNRGPLRPDDWVVDAESNELLCRAHFRARQEMSGGGSGRASFSAPSC